MLTKACEAKWYPEIVVSFHYILTSFTLRGPSSEKLSHSGVTGPASVHSKDYRLVALPQRQEMESASWSHLPDAWAGQWKLTQQPWLLTWPPQARRAGSGDQVVRSPAGNQMQSGANWVIPFFLASPNTVYPQIHTGTVDTGRILKGGG